MHANAEDEDGERGHKAMAEGSKGGAPKLAHTDFESMTHEQLLALVESASSEGASQLAGKLGKAASTITKIGDDLMTYTKGLHWQGEGGDAFRAWGTQSASATLYLGEYSEVASRWMGVVAEAIAEAKASMPPASDTTQAKADLRSANKNMAAAQKAHNDPDAAKVTRDSKADAAAAQGRIEAAQAEAVQRMRKLAQTYQQSAQQVNGVTPPTFAPPASHSDNPDGWRDGGSYQALPDQAGGPTAGGPATGGPAASGPVSAMPVPSAAAPSAGYGAPGASPEGAASATPPTSSQPHRTEPVSMGIDRVTTLPPSSPPPEAPPGPGPVPPGRPEVLTPPGLGTAPPPFGPNPGQPGPTTPPPGRPSPAVRPSLPPSQGGSNYGPGNRPPKEPGIIGGRPLPPNSGRPTTGIPRSNVFGGDHMQGRPPMSPGVGPGVHGPGAGRTGVVGGRRLTGEPGGAIGRQPYQPGRVDGRPFTPGGAGLVRGSATGDSTHSGAMGRPATAPQGGQGNSSRRDEGQPERSNHLFEEEETWQPDHRRIVPPVID